MKLKSLLKIYEAANGWVNIFGDDIDFRDINPEDVEWLCPELLNRTVDHIATHVSGCLTIVLKNA